jgi:hypothetical protein
VEPAQAEEEEDEVEIGEGHVGEAAAVGETEGEAGRGADDERQERVGAGGGLRVSHGSLWGLGWGSFARRTEWRVVWSRVPSTFPRGKKSTFPPPTLIEVHFYSLNFKTG